jgi:hypothetical protein
MYQIFIVPYLYEAQPVLGDTPPIIRSLKLHWQPLVFHTWKVVWTCSWWTLSGTLCLTTSTNYILKEVKQYQEKWLQHVQKMDTNIIPKQALQYKPKDEGT